MDMLIIFSAKYLVLLVVLTLGIAWLLTKRQRKLHFILSTVLAGIIAFVAARTLSNFIHSDRPFVIEGMITGLIGAVLAVLGTWGVFRLLSNSVVQLTWIPGAWLIAGVAAGTVVGLLASMIAVRRHLGHSLGVDDQCTAGALGHRHAADAVVEQGAGTFGQGGRAGEAENLLVVGQQVVGVRKGRSDPRQQVLVAGSKEVDRRGDSARPGAGNHLLALRARLVREVGLQRLDGRRPKRRQLPAAGLAGAGGLERAGHRR